MDHEEEKKGLERRLKEINFVVWRWEDLLIYFIYWWFQASTQYAQYIILSYDLDYLK
jgi:hypothetical protein